MAEVKLNVRVYDGPASLARGVAEEFARIAASSVIQRAAFRVGLSGGNTPQRLYGELSDQKFRDRVDWWRTVVCFADERAVPPDHPDSNYRLVRERLADEVGIPEGNIHRMRGEATDLDAAAREYEPVLVEPLDLLLIGVGPDGHVASIFPGSPVVTELGRRVVAVAGSPKPPPRRLTVTPRVFREAREVLVMASGEDKARAVAKALERDEAPIVVPARLLRDRLWCLDRDAAMGLPRE